MLQFNFKIAHIAGSVNTAADFLSQLELKVTEKIRLKIRLRCTNNAHWEHNILLRCCRWRAIFLYTDRWWRWDWRTNPWKERTISEKGNRMGSTWGTILNEAKYERIYKDWQKHYVVLHTRNQGKCTDTSRTRCRSGPENLKTQNT